MKPTIHLALTHDWELRGDGSGNIEKIQFAPMRNLLEIYRKHNARTTFLPDVMQQLAFRRLQAQYSELKSLADSWDEHVCEAFRQGHDIQLHLHPQWRDANYKDGSWRLSDDWSIVNYDAAAAQLMLAESKQYLETLLRPIDSEYRCLAFRAGALAAAPSNHLFKSLVALKIELDVSIAGGLLVDNDRLHLDYHNCEESFLPFYPVMTDARKVSEKPEAIVCVPLNHFYGSRRAVSRQNLSLVWRELKSHSAQARPKHHSQAKPGWPRPDSRTLRIYEKLFQPLIKRKYFVSDTARLSYPLMREMLESIQLRARNTHLPQVPVVLMNHPKEIRDICAIKRFVGDISRTGDIKFITLKELAAKLRNGEFHIRIRA